MTTRDEKILLLAALLLAQGATLHAAPVTRTEPVGVDVFMGNVPSYTETFLPITNADELISISGGSLFAPEGFTFELDVHYVPTGSQSIYAINSITFLSLSSLADLPFAMGNIDGLIFRVSNNQTAVELTIPRGTVFTFNGSPDVIAGPGPGRSVPEPSSLALLAAAGVGLLNWRRRSVQLVQEGTTSE